MADGPTDGRVSAALADILDEAVSIAPLTDARLSLALQVRRSRPASIRDVLLLAVVRYLHERMQQARRREPRIADVRRDLFPELPLGDDDAALLTLLAAPKGGR